MWSWLKIDIVPNKMPQTVTTEIIYDITLDHLL